MPCATREVRESAKEVFVKGIKPSIHEKQKRERGCAQLADLERFEWTILWLEVVPLAGGFGSLFAPCGSLWEILIMTSSVPTWITGGFFCLLRKGCVMVSDKTVLLSSGFLTPFEVLTLSASQRVMPL